MWKHLNSSQPAFYNAQDAYAADVNHLKTCRDLHKHGLWSVYQDLILDMDPIWTAMSAAGMPIDAEKRFGFAQELTDLQRDCRQKMQEVVPDECRNFQPRQGYVRAPDLAAVRASLEEGEELVEHLFEAQTVKRCSQCRERAPKREHFKSKLFKVCSVCSLKWTKKHKCQDYTPVVGECLGVETNPCATAIVISVQEGLLRWVRRQPFVPSPKQILAYQKVKGQAPVMEGKGEQRRPTTNAKAIKKLRAKYHDDPLYPLLLDDRKITKLGGAYIGWIKEGKLVGGFPVGRDNRVRAQFTNAPSTLRTSMRAPNLQTMVRG